jgi:glycosyltransferase involved in cell wall biosynthesis
MLEVMAFEVPVLASAVFGVPELIRDGIDGILFEPRCLGSLESALDRFLSLDPGERRGLGRRGAVRISHARDSRRYAEEYRSLLDGYVSSPTAMPRDLVAARQR